MGGSMKGQNGNGNRGRKYGVMLFMAFGAAIVGVMLLHKFRERRLFNLLIEEKDHDLFSLQLLLKKEIEYNKAAKGKFEEMNAKIYSLQTQNADLHDRILEMQSIISSLKDEQRTMESALEEKRNEIKLLQEKDLETSQGNSQVVVTLKETLKQKEAEIEDLKLHLGNQIKLESMSLDDQSSPAVNSTHEGSGGLIRNSTRYRDFGNSSRGADYESLNESNAYRDGDNSTRDEDTTGEHSLKLESSRDVVGGDGSSGGEKSTKEVQAKKVKDSQNGKEVGMKGEKNNTIASATIVNNGDVSKTRDGYSDINATDVKENSVDGIGGEVQQLGMEYRGGMKLEKKLDGSRASAGYRVKGKHGNSSNSRGKRWRVIARNRRHWVNTNAENHQDDALQSRRYKRRLIDDELLKLSRHRGGHHMGLKREDESGEGSEELEVHGNEYPRGGSSEMKNNQSSGNVEVNNEIEKRFQRLDEMQVNKTIDREASETARVDESEQKPDELGQSEERDNGDRADRKSEEMEDVEDKYEEAAEDLEVAERDFRESGPKLEEEKQESGEETDESEF